MFDPGSLNLSETAIDVRPGQQEAVITGPELFPGPVRFSIPEFHGKNEGRPFGIIQAFLWREVERRRVATCVLEGEPEEIGLECEGQLEVLSPASVAFEASLHNLHEAPVFAAHHTLLLDLSARAEFHDRSGERTFVYTNTGWCPLPDLIGRSAPAGATMRVGASYSGGRTVIWKIIARASLSGEYVIALALDRGYAFSSNHPEWPDGLLGGCRWGTLGPDETKTMHGRVYLVRGNLNDVRRLYAKDFK